MTSPNQKKVKAWAVLAEGNESVVLVYSARPQAQTLTVVPCTITYQLPAKKKKK